MPGWVNRGIGPAGGFVETRFVLMGMGVGPELEIWVDQPVAGGTWADQGTAGGTWTDQDPAGGTWTDV